MINMMYSYCISHAHFSLCRAAFMEFSYRRWVHDISCSQGQIPAGYTVCKKQYVSYRIFFLTSWESKVTRSPSLAIPSSFSSFRCGHSARQNARAIRSVSRLCSAESVTPPLGWSPLCRKKTCTRQRHRCGGHRYMLLLYMHHHTYFCPADDLPIFFVFWLLEHLHAADGLHGFPIDGANNSEGHKHYLDNYMSKQFTTVSTNFNVVHFKACLKL